MGLQKCEHTDNGQRTTGARMDNGQQRLHPRLVSLVFESPVRSGLLAPSALDCNHNRSSQFEKLQKTGLNHDRPVKTGLVLNLVLTSW